MRSLSSIFVSLVLLTPFFALAQTTPSLEELYAGGPDAPVINALDYPDEESWYRATEAKFSWELPGDIFAVAVELFSLPNQEPIKSFRPAISSYTIPAKDLIEGTQYLSVQFKNEEKWGMYSFRKIKIDNTPPTLFPIKVKAAADSSKGTVLYFEAEDLLSGVSHYEITVANAPPEKISLEEATRGHWLTLTSMEPVTIKVVAYDKAGNIADTLATIYPTEALGLSSKNTLGSVSENPASVLVALMSTIMLLLLGYLIYERQRYAHALRNLREETEEVHTKLMKIFTALRIEIFNQINRIDKKPRLTKNEKEAVTGLHKALEVSESLLAKEVKDIKKLLY